MLFLFAEVRDSALEAMHSTLYVLSVPKVLSEKSWVVYLIGNGIIDPKALNTHSAMRFSRELEIVPTGKLIVVEL